MVSDALLAYFHFAAMFGMVFLLAAELATCTQAASPNQLNRLRALDGLYGLFAMLTLASGAARLMWGAKGSAFYLANPVFHVKITLFVVAALISIYPTVQFLRWSKSVRADARFLPEAEAIKRVRTLIATQMSLLAVIPMAATLMARGIGQA